MTRFEEFSRSKVPEVTLAFWIIKIVATTLGETGGDALSMTLDFGYALSTAIFLGYFVVLAVAQIRARAFHPALYWLVIVATTTAGTTLADYFDRSLGIGYIGGSLCLLVLLASVLTAWRFSEGSVSVNRITSPTAEGYYWATIFASNTLGTALGDFLADDGGLGYEGGALVFLGLLALVAAAYYWTKLSRTLLFWAAFILTRPLGAMVGDLLDKPLADGGLALSRITASLVLAGFMVLLIVVTPQRAGRHPGSHELPT